MHASGARGRYLYRAVRLERVLALPPEGCQYVGLNTRIKQLPVQRLVPKLIAKRLNASVLPWTSELEV